jgi:hypothetical protein
VISLFAAERELQPVVLLPDDISFEDYAHGFQVHCGREAEWQFEHHASGNARTPLLLCVDLAPSIPGPSFPFERTLYDRMLQGWSGESHLLVMTTTLAGIPSEEFEAQLIMKELIGF